MALTTGKVRFSFVHLWEPQVPQGGGEPKYSVTILIPKTDVNTLNAIYAEMEAVKQSGISAVWGGNLPPIVKIPLYDGDGVRPSGEPFGPECKGHMVITASSKTQPYIVDLNVQPILNRADVYSGCYGRANINLFAYNQAGNKGLGCGLNGIQKIEDGESLTGGVSAQEAFGGSNAYGGIPSVGQASTMTNPGVRPAVTPGYPVATPASPAMGYPQTPYSVDPITGAPLMSGGVMGI